MQYLFRSNAIANLKRPLTSLRPTQICGACFACLRNLDIACHVLRPILGSQIWAQSEVRKWDLFQEFRIRQTQFWDPISGLKMRAKNCAISERRHTFEASQNLPDVRTTPDIRQKKCTAACKRSVVGLYIHSGCHWNKLVVAVEKADPCSTKLVKRSQNAKYARQLK